MIATLDAPPGTVTLPARNIGVPGETSGDDMGRRLFLRASDIARMWGEERARARARAEGRDEAAAVAAAVPVKLRTVYRYVQQSRTGLYRTNPMPMPEYPDDEPKPGQIPLWLPEEGETVDDLERRVRAWWHSRPGPGVGGGRPPKQRRERVSCPCGCGELVAAGSMCDRSAAERAEARR